MFERRKVVNKSKPTQKLKHTNSILDYFEYFFQISSKSILIILSYTVSKFVRFLRHSIYLHQRDYKTEVNGIVLRTDVLVKLFCSQIVSVTELS